MFFTNFTKYFGETFLRENCRKRCDNCKNQASYVSKDVSQDVKDIISLGTYCDIYICVTNRTYSLVVPEGEPYPELLCQSLYGI